MGAGFVLQMVFTRWFGAGKGFESLFAVTVAGLQEGKFWTLLTHGFLHSPYYLFHIMGTVGGLYFLGRELLPLVGARRFIGLFGSALVAGALTWAAVNWNRTDTSGPATTLFGGTAAIDALLVVFVCFYPNREVTIPLLFFPVTFKPRHFVYTLVALDTAGMVFYEILGAVSPFDVAHSAHLGGIATGWFYYRFVHETSWLNSRRKSDLDHPAWTKRRARVKPEAAADQANVVSRGDLRIEVDRILDKIISEGFAALTPEEKRVLDEAKDTLSRR